jgi:hypothetical protein
MSVIMRECISDTDSQEIDSFDKELILLVTKGYSSSYSMWAFMKRNFQGKVMAYINVNKRVTRLVKAGFLEEIRPGSYTVNIHGRKDYKVTVKGMVQLIPHILTHHDEVKGLDQYMDKIALDKIKFTLSLLEGLASAMESVNEYHSQTKMVYFPFKDIVSKGDKPPRKDILDEYTRIMERLAIGITTMSSDIISTRKSDRLDAKTRSRYMEIEARNKEFRNSIAEREKKHQK